MDQAANPKESQRYVPPSSELGEKRGAPISTDRGNNAYSGSIHDTLRQHKQTVLDWMILAANPTAEASASANVPRARLLELAVQVLKSGASPPPYVQQSVDGFRDRLRGLQHVYQRYGYDEPRDAARVAYYKR